jgi:hypothetical protein
MQTTADNYTDWDLEQTIGEAFPPVLDVRCESGPIFFGLGIGLEIIIVAALLPCSRDAAGSSRAAVGALSDR